MAQKAHDKSQEASFVTAGQDAAAGTVCRAYNIINSAATSSADVDSGLADMTRSAEAASPDFKATVAQFVTAYRTGSADLPGATADLVRACSVHGVEIGS